MSDASPVETVTTPVRPRPTDRPSRRAPATSSAAFEQLVEVGAADDAGRAERRVHDPVLARERSGVGDGGGLGLLAAAHLDGEDRLADRERVVREGEEPLGPLEPLDEEDDRVRRLVVEAVGEVVAQVEHDLRAAADDARPADPRAGVDERVRDAAGLGDAGDAAATSHGVTSPMYVALRVVRSTMPMQFGPRIAVPVAIAISRTSACIRAAASPPSTTPPPGMTTVRTPASAASRVNCAARSGFTARTTVSGTSGSAARSG